MWLDEPHPAYFGYGWMRRYAEKLGEYVTRQSPARGGHTASAVYGREIILGRYESRDTGTDQKGVQGESPYVVWGSGNEVKGFHPRLRFARACCLPLKSARGSTR